MYLSRFRMGSIINKRILILEWHLYHMPGLKKCKELWNIRWWLWLKNNIGKFIFQKMQPLKWKCNLQNRQWNKLIFKRFQNKIDIMELVIWFLFIQLMTNILVIEYKMHYISSISPIKHIKCVDIFKIEWFLDIGWFYKLWIKFTVRKLFRCIWIIVLHFAKIKFWFDNC